MKRRSYFGEQTLLTDGRKQGAGSPQRTPSSPNLSGAHPGPVAIPRQRGARPAAKDPLGKALSAHFPLSIVISMPKTGYGNH